MSESAGKGAVITGAGRGIGLACARLMAQRGGSVILLGHDRELLQGADETFRTEKLNAAAIVADISVEAEVADAIKRAREILGSIDVMVNNAAVQPYGTVASKEPAAWDHVIGLNLRWTYPACHHALPHMVKAGRGSIVNISSVQALANQARVAAYATSKGGILAFARSIAVDFGFAGIRANAVCPGCIDAPMTRFSATETAPGREDEIIRDGARRSLSVGSGGRKRWRRSSRFLRATERTSAPAPNSRSTAA